MKWVMSLLILFTSNILTAKSNKINLPERQANAMTGTEFFNYVQKKSGTYREKQIYQEIVEGNIPNKLKTLKPITFISKVNGKQHKITFFVMKDFFAIGSDQDFVRVPMNLPTALKLCKKLNMVLPTSRMVDIISASADYRLSSIVLPPSSHMAETFYYEKHSKLLKYDELTSPFVNNDRNSLIDGHKKSIIMSKKLFSNPDRIAIYGWSGKSKKNIQPVSIFHQKNYVDYSHGLRLVSNRAIFDGKEVNLTQFLQSQYAEMLSDEGILKQLSSYLQKEEVNF